MPTPTPGRPAATGLLAVGVIALVGSRLVAGDPVFKLWADRDLVRAADLLDGVVHVAGAELSYDVGGRIPGGAQYALMALPMLLWPDPVAVHRWALILDALALLLLTGAIARRLGAWPAAVAATIYAASPASAVTLGQLWNPAWSPLFVVGTVLGAASAVERRQASPLAWALPLAALATQMHLAAGLVATLAVGVAVAHRPRGLRGLALGAAGALATYLPYLAVEVTTGWPNTRLLLAPGQTEDLRLLAEPSRLGTRNLFGVLDQLAGPRAWELARAWAEATPTPTVAEAALAATGLGLALVGATTRRWWGPTHDGLTRVAGWTWVTALVAMSASQRISLVDTLRYTFPTVGLQAALAGAGAAWLAARGGPRARTATVWGLTLVVAAHAAPAVALVHGPWRETTTWSATQRYVDAARSVLDASDPADALDRTVLVRDDVPPGWDATDPDAWLRHRSDRPAAGATAGPCALVFVQRHLDADEARRAAEAALGRRVGAITIDAVHHLGKDTAARVRHAAPRCRSSFANRYRLTDDDRRALAAADLLAPGEHTAAPPASPHGRRVIASLPDRPIPWDGDPLVDVLVVLDVDVDGDLVRVRLSSPQLRGAAFNDGFFATAQIHRPVVRFARGTDGVDVALADGLVGRFGALAPLRASVILPPGTWTVDLLTDRVEPALDGPFRPFARETIPVEQRLVDALVVPARRP